ncbi:ABC transporter ATP-binding protein [Haoranjiania flava]|uniref:ABC transporter ATP-binding protein/permease n=1 Tax=Haoranjiania flava TaxID=1856322 RepID=A0AAE3ILE5_9BACT|nr:ABC transporter ATP-binding protein [Haoranjiania flava]MCU7693829.1 ABC transporter ATP-binding protein/permease [Haoranjiania flava]
MKHLKAVNKYLWKYRLRFFAGILFICASNYFAVLAPEITGYVINKVQEMLPNGKPASVNPSQFALINNFFAWVDQFDYGKIVVISSLVILLLAVIRGVMMFFMRQTMIVMSRHIEYDQKNEVYDHYQKLDAGFYKMHSTGDLMNRMAEDVSRVRFYTGPAIMHLVNLVSIIAFCLFNMFGKDVKLSLLTLAPLPVLAVTIYFVNSIIHKKSEVVQAKLSDITTTAQESYSGIRVIKSFVQEKSMINFFRINNDAYRTNAISLAKIESVFFPTTAMIVGLSTLLTIFIGSMMILNNSSSIGVVVEFVMYINMLIFPFTAIGWVANMIQRASASQKRLNEFLETQPEIEDKPGTINADINADIRFDKVSFTYKNTGIKALDHLSLDIRKGEKVLVLGKTGSGKTTLAQLLLHFYEPDEGKILIDNTNINNIRLSHLRDHISYVPQDVFLFSDTVYNNIAFGLKESPTVQQVENAAKLAGIHNEILSLDNGYQTRVGERGVTLSGGQKQRISIARALIKKPELMIFDDCLSAVDAKTENIIINNLNTVLGDKTAIIITHRIFTVFDFSKIIVLDEGRIIEQGSHAALIKNNGYYAELYNKQVMQA